MKTYTFLFFFLTNIAWSACKKETATYANLYTDPKLIIAYTLDTAPFVSHAFLITH
jgi:hypothetical protein